MHFGTLSHVYSVKHFEVARQQTHHQRLAPLPQNFSLDCSTVHHCLNRFWYREGRRIVWYLSILHALFPLLDLALGYVKEFFFLTTESSALLVITDSLVISCWSFQLVDSLSLSSQLKHFCSFNSLSCQIFFVSELYLCLQGIRGIVFEENGFLQILHFAQLGSSPYTMRLMFLKIVTCWFSLEI
jgi:hypothetical protein